MRCTATSAARRKAAKADALKAGNKQLQLLFQRHARRGRKHRRRELRRQVLVCLGLMVPQPLGPRLAELLSDVDVKSWSQRHPFRCVGRECQCERENTHESAQSDHRDNHHRDLGRFCVRAKRTVPGKSVWRRNKCDSAIADRSIDSRRNGEHKGRSCSWNECATGNDRIGCQRTDPVIQRQGVAREKRKSCVTRSRR